MTIECPLCKTEFQNNECHFGGDVECINPDCKAIIEVEYDEGCDEDGNEFAFTWIAGAKRE